MWHNDGHVHHSWGLAAEHEDSRAWILQKRSDSADTCALVAYAPQRAAAAGAAARSSPRLSSPTFWVQVEESVWLCCRLSLKTSMKIQSMTHRDLLQTALQRTPYVSILSSFCPPPPPSLPSQPSTGGPGPDPGFLLLKGSLSGSDNKHSDPVDGEEGGCLGGSTFKPSSVFEIPDWRMTGSSLWTCCCSRRRVGTSCSSTENEAEPVAASVSPHFSLKSRCLLTEGEIEAEQRVC